MIQRKKIISINQLKIGSQKVDVIILKNSFFPSYKFSTFSNNTILILPFKKLIWTRQQTYYEGRNNARCYFYSKDKSNQLAYFDKRVVKMSKKKTTTTNPLTINIFEGYSLDGAIGLKGDFIYRLHYDAKFSDAYSFKQQIAIKKNIKKTIKEVLFSFYKKALIKLDSISP